MPSVISRTTLALAIGLVALFSVPGASAAAEWSAPSTLASIGQSIEPIDVAIDPQGDEVAVWQTEATANPEIESAFKPAGAGWQSPTTLSDPGPETSGPHVAFDGAEVVVRSAVRGSMVSLTLRCPGVETCTGVVKLSSPLTGQGKSRGVRKPVYLTSGAFSIGPGGRRTIHLRLAHSALQAIDVAPGHRLKVDVAGRGVESRTLILAFARDRGKTPRGHTR
jgi:hypothetical protein